ncbi:hypothetical protein [Chitinophaga sp.]|uniref:hypothetical protein n=1 Tax=Chitinophaga sp. TaxID=1869181 RepID=UPI0031DAD3B1
MIFELKKVTWAADNIPNTPQTLSLSFRKQDAPDVADSYTLVTDSLFVLTSGTVINPPIIRGLENATRYVFRLTNNDPYGGSLDVSYTTPEELTFPQGSGESFTNARIDYTQADANFYAGMVPSGIAFYSLENNFKDLVGGHDNIQENGTAILKKAQGFTGMYIDCQNGMMMTTDLNMAPILGDPSTYGLGVYFYVAAADLSTTGTWPLLSCLDSDGHGVIVYIDNATKQLVWQQKNAALTETVRSTVPILVDTWNSMLVGNYTVLSGGTMQNFMYLNGAAVGTGAITTASSPALVGNTWLAVGGATTGSGYSGKGIFRNVFVTGSIQSFSGDVGFSTLTYPVGYLQDRYDAANLITIPHDYLVGISKTQVSFTIPENVPVGSYNFYVKYNGKTTAPVEVFINHVYKDTNAFDINLAADTDSNNLTNIFQMTFFAVGENKDGGADGGVVPKNVYFKDGLVVLEAHGDWYDGLVQGVDTDGTPKKHTEKNDPLIGEYWKTRVGAAVATKSYHGYGRYIVEAKLPKQLGVSPFFRLYHHARAQFQDPFYEQCLNNGLHQQGSSYEGDGYYAVVRNEFAMELPANNSVFDFYTLDEITNTNYFSPYAGMKVTVSYDEPANNGTWQLNTPAAPKLLSSWSKYSDEIQYLFQPRRDQVKLTNSKGVLGSGAGLSRYTVDNEDEYLEMRAPIGKDVWDDAFHEFRIDWYANRVEYYIDGVLLQTNPFYVPDIIGRFSFGLSFPSAAQNGARWLPDPFQLSAGTAAWHHQAMTIRRVAFTPFTDAVAGGTNRVVGETDPFGGLYYFPYVPA